MTQVSTTRFGDLIRQWRQRRRMSQLDLGLVANVSSRHVSFIETGRSTPSRAMVLRLADALAVPPREQNRLLIAATRDLGGVAVPLELYTTDGRLLTFLNTVTTFGTALDLTAAELSLEAFLPADAASAGAMR